MTADVGECNGRSEGSKEEFEGSKGEVEMNREGDLKDGSIACQDGEEIDGSFVIVNGDSDDHSDRDLDLVRKSDPTPDADTGDLKSEGEEIGGKEESLAEDGVKDDGKLSEKNGGSDDKSEEKQGDENLVGERSIEEEKEVKVDTEEEQNGIGSGSRNKVEEGQESMTEVKLESDAQIEQEENEKDDNLKSGSNVKIEHEEEETADANDLGSSDAVEKREDIEALGLKAEEKKEVLLRVEEKEAAVVIAESETKEEFESEVEKEDVKESETFVTETDLLEKSEPASRVGEEKELVSMVAEADEKGDVGSMNVEESQKLDDRVQEIEIVAELGSSFEAELNKVPPTVVEQAEDAAELVSDVEVKLKQEPNTGVEKTENSPKSGSAVEVELKQPATVAEEMDKDDLEEGKESKVVVEENDNQAEIGPMVEVEPEREPETVSVAPDKIEAEERNQPEAVVSEDSAFEYLCLESGVEVKPNADGDAQTDEPSGQFENGSTDPTVEISGDSLTDRLNGKTRDVPVENSGSPPISHVAAKELVEEVSHSSDHSDVELEVSNGETVASQLKTDNSLEEPSSSGPVTGVDLEPQKSEELCPHKDSETETKDSLEDVETEKDVVVEGMKLESESENESAEGSEFMVSSIEVDQSTNKDDDEEPSHEQAQAAEMLQAPPETHVVKRQPVYMIKVPRFIDDELQKKIQDARSMKDEKTKERDSIRKEIRDQTITVNNYSLDYKAELAKERAARAVFVAKRQEVENTQELINRINNANSIADIDEKIRNMVHRQQHETISLKQEKQYIHDINQMKRLREQLSSRKATQEQIDEVLSQKDGIELKLKNLKKELDSQRAALLSAESSTKSAWNEYMDQVQRLNNLNEKYNVADGDRQAAYLQWRNLQNQSADKIKHFKMYKADQSAATNYIFSGDSQGLLSHCSKQVERILDLWNNNTEFREQYVKSNIYSTLRRLGTSDGRSLGPGEEAPILRPHVDKSSNTISVPSSNMDTPAPVLASEIRQGNLTEHSATEQIARVNQSAKLKTSAKSAVAEGSMSTVSNSKESKEAEKENKRNKEEEELARKAEELARKEEELKKEKAAKEEELRKEKAAAEFKEQLRLEQRAKAREAEERKRRKAEKAQAKAEYRAQKEAELKEKKKAKKETKKSGIVDTEDASTGGGSTPVPVTNPPETLQEPETSSGATTRKRSVKPASSVKQYNRVQPLPLPLRNRGKRKMTTWMWVSVVILLVLILFFAGNYISFSISGLPEFGF